MDLLIGQFAALGAAVCWTICSPCFTLAGRRIGSLSVNLHRLLLGCLFLTIYCACVRGMPLPTDAPPEAWGWLIVSGLIGFFFCDLCLFRSFLLIGPRLALLVMSLAPPLAAIISWLFRGERLTMLEVTGMTVALTGVIWVVLEGNRQDNDIPHEHWKMGLLLAVMAVFGQALGMIFADIGVDDYDPFAANQIRSLAGLVGFVIMITCTRSWRVVMAGLKDAKAVSWLTLGAVTGPFLGVGFALLSLKHVSTGTAMTIMALPPVLILPVSKFLLKEQISGRAAFGAVIAVVGVSILFLQ